MPLAHSLVTSRQHAPRKWLLFLHGILGSRSNWRSIARTVVDGRPEWGAVLVDLREHGESRGMPPPHTVAQAAADLDALREHVDGPLEGVLGHSFGGKVGLHWSSHHADSLGSTWIVDSLPGRRPEGRGSETTLQVLDMLEKMTFPVESREAFVQRVQDHGYVTALGHWLAMNLARREDGQYDFGLDLEAIRALLDDYFVQDLWPAVEHWSGPGGLHLVLGEQSDVYSPEDRQRAHSLAAAEPHVHVHTLATGHWVHVEAPKQLAQLLIDRLP